MEHSQWQSLPLLDAYKGTEIEDFVATAHGDVSYCTNANFMGTKTTATITDGRCVRHEYASAYMERLKEAERLAAYVPPVKPTATGPRSQPYTGPFPRGRHSHRCKGCEIKGEYHAVACYKAKCTRPQLTATCPSCAAAYK